MRRAPWIIGSITLIAAGGCGSGTSGTTGSGGGTTPATASASSTTGTGGGPVFTRCNPFTGAPCDVAGGQTCDWDGASFSCFDPPNEAKLCEDCGPGAYCVVGMNCIESKKCSPFCCDDADCGSGGICNKVLIGDGHVGVCTAAPSGTGGSDGGITLAQPACNAPATPPSAGACYVPPSGG